MREEYATEEEYDSLFVTLTRGQVADDIKVGRNVLDIATGSAYFSIQVAQRNPDSFFTAVDIFEGSVEQAKKNTGDIGLANRIKVIKMDASSLDFSDNEFDTAINYLGLEDIHMTRGKQGVEATFREVFRVLKHSGSFYFVAMPPDEMESIPQRIEVDVFSWICGATWLDTDQYIGFAEDAGFVFKRRQSYYTGKKLTVEQAMEEIEYACLNVPVNYGVKAKSFRGTWDKFSALIEEHGMGHYSKTVLFEVKKPINS